MLSFQSQLSFIVFFVLVTLLKNNHYCAMHQHNVRKHLHLLVGIYCILCLRHAWPVYMLSSSANHIKYKMQAFACVCNLL